MCDNETILNFLYLFMISAHVCHLYTNDFDYNITIKVLTVTAVSHANIISQCIFQCGLLHTYVLHVCVLQDKEICNIVNT